MDEASGRTRSSMNGYVPQDMTFNDWLKTQTDPKATKNQAVLKEAKRLFGEPKILEI